MSRLAIGISEKSAIQSLTLSPNPVKDVLYLNNLPDRNGRFSIINITGMEVMSGSIQHGNLELYSLENGLYHITVQQGNVIYQGRFIKE